MLTLYCGNFLATHCTESHLSATLESLGHEVIRMQENLTTAEEILATIRVRRPRLMVWTRTWRLKGDCLAMLAECKALGVATAAIHLDLYLPLRRGHEGGHEGKGVTNDPWWRSAYVFSPDGDPRSEAEFRALGINHHYLPPGVYHAEAYMAAPDPARAVDVAFVGSYHYHEEFRWRPQLIDWLKATYGSRFRLTPGPGQDAVRNHALNVLYASAKVVVGDTLCPGYTHERYTSDRLFETTGRGGFLIYPRIKGITDGTLVTEGEHIACYNYGDFDGLKRTIDYYLEHDAERERIRLAGHEHTKAHHTYRERLTEALAVVAAGEGWASW